MNNSKDIKNAVKLYRFFVFELQGNSDLSLVNFEDIKSSIQDIKDNYLDNVDLSILNKEDNLDSDIVQALEILETCLSATDSDFNDLEYFEFFDLLQEILTNYKEKTPDFYIDSLPCGECRLIHKSEIDDIWTESLIEMVKDCYDLSVLDDLPSFVAVSIDWESTAENAKVDGKGHHFSGYDGEHHEASTYDIFRTN